MNGMDAHARKHTQARYGGMAKEHEPVAANTTRKGGPRMDNESEVHNATLLPLSIGHQRGRVKEWEHNKQICPRKRNVNATAADRHTMVWHEG